MQSRTQLGHAVVQLAEALRYYVTGNFHWHNPSGRTMALGSNQPLTEKSSGNISWRLKVAGADG